MPRISGLRPPYFAVILLFSGMIFMDHAVFYSNIRRSIFGGSLSQSAVDNINAILAFWDQAHAGNPLGQLAYILATVRAEVGLKMAPVRETFANSDAQARARLAHKPYAQSVPPHGHAYYGRGYVQLTWHRNYERQEAKLGVPLVAEPDLALRAEVAIQVLVGGMMAGDFNGHGHGLPHYVNATHQDFVEARRTVNVLDRAHEIADYATRFLDALERAVEAETIPTESLTLDGDLPPLRPSPEHLAAQHELIERDPH